MLPPPTPHHWEGIALGLSLGGGSEALGRVTRHPGCWVEGGQRRCSCSRWPLRTGASVTSAWWGWSPAGDVGCDLEGSDGSQRP